MIPESELLDRILAFLEPDEEEPEEEPTNCDTEPGLCTRCVPLPTRFGA